VEPKVLLPYSQEPTQYLSIEFISKGANIFWVINVTLQYWSCNQIAHQSATANEQCFWCSGRKAIDTTKWCEVNLTGEATETTKWWEVNLTGEATEKT
jgi:hypothetical protein